MNETNDHSGPNAAAAAGPARSVTAVGSGTAQASPDVAVVRVGTEARSAHVGDAYARAANTARALVDAARAAGIRREDLATSGLGVRSETVWQEGQGARVVGYAATTALTFTAPPDPGLSHGARWDVTLRTTCGDIRLLLDGAAAPRSVASFVTLARAGYWHDSVCHRLTTKQAPTAYLQCGDPTGRSTADPGYDLPIENTPEDRRYTVGTVGMARGDGYPGTAGEFFMVHEDFTVPADHVAYSVIGRVVSGQEVVEHIAREGGEDTRPDGPPFQSISIRDVFVTRVPSG